MTGAVERRGGKVETEKCNGKGRRVGYGRSSTSTSEPVSEPASELVCLRPCHRPVNQWKQLSQIYPTRNMPHLSMPRHLPPPLLSLAPSRRALLFEEEGASLQRGVSPAQVGHRHRNPHLVPSAGSNAPMMNFEQAGHPHSRYWWCLDLRACTTCSHRCKQSSC